MIVRIESSRCTFALEGTKALVVSWGGHRKIAAGYVNGKYVLVNTNCDFLTQGIGAVVVWNMEAALGGGDSNAVENSRKYIELSFNILDASVRCIAWRGFNDPDRLLVAGYDGRLMLLDINDPFIPFTLQRARGKADGTRLVGVCANVLQPKVSCMLVHGRDIPS